MMRTTNGRGIAAPSLQCFGSDRLKRRRFAGFVVPNQHKSDEIVVALGVEKPVLLHKRDDALILLVVVVEYSQ